MEEFLTGVAETTTPEDLERPAPTQELLDKLLQANAQRLRALFSYGHQPDPRTVLAIRLETFIETFIPEEDKLAFELNFETRMAEVLKDMISQAAKAQITQGVPAGAGAKKLYVAGK